MKRYEWILLVAVLSCAAIVFGDGIPFNTATDLNKETKVVIKFVADTQELGADESFPTFVCEPNEGDYIMGFTGKWYVITRRTHDWAGRPGRSPPRFTIWIDRTDPPPTTAEGTCK